MNLAHLNMYNLEELDSLTINESIESADFIDMEYYMHPDFPNAIWIASSVVLAILGAFGITSNLTIVMAYLKNDSLHDDFTLLLMNLIFAELIMALFGIPINFTASVMHGWNLGETMCNAFGFALTLGGMVSIYTLTALSIYRFWTMFNMTGDRSGFIFTSMEGLSHYLSGKKVISITWALGLSMAIPPLTGWSYYSPEPNGLSCAPAWYDPKHASFIVYIFMLGFLTPNAIIIFTSIRVLSLHKEHSINASGRIAEIIARRQKKATQMVILIIFSFNFCWGPYAFVCLLKLFQMNFVTPVWSIPGFLLAKSSCCWNPIIYIFLNPKFRRAVLPQKFQTILEEITNGYNLPRNETKQMFGLNIVQTPNHVPCDKPAEQSCVIIRQESEKDEGSTNEQQYQPLLQQKSEICDSMLDKFCPENDRSSSRDKTHNMFRIRQSISAYSYFQKCTENKLKLVV